MNGRERLVEWANNAPDDFVKGVVREAERHASDNSEGDDELDVFVRTLVAALELKRPTGTPRKGRFDADLSKFRHWAGRKLSHGEIAKALAQSGVISQSTVRSRLRTIDARRARIATLLDSPIAEEGRAMMGMTFEHGTGSAD